MFKSSDIAYWKNSNLNKILLILGIGCGLCFNCLFRFIKSLIKHTQFDLALVYLKDEDPYHESFDMSRTISLTQNPTPFEKNLLL